MSLSLPATNGSSWLRSTCENSTSLWGEYIGAGFRLIQVAVKPSPCVCLIVHCHQPQTATIFWSSSSPSANWLGRHYYIGRYFARMGFILTWPSTIALQIDNMQTKNHWSIQKNIPCSDDYVQIYKLYKPCVYLRRGMSIVNQPPANINHHHLQKHWCMHQSFIKPYCSRFLVRLYSGLILSTQTILR